MVKVQIDKKLKSTKKNKAPRKINVKSKLRLTIKSRMIISYVLCVAIPLILVNILATVNSRHTLKKTSSQLAVEMTQQTMTNVSSYVDEVEKITGRIILNDLNASSYNLINEYMLACRAATDNKGFFERNSIERNIKSQLLYSLTLDDRVSNVALVFNEGDRVVSTYTQKVQDGALTEDDIKKIAEDEQGNSVTWNTDLEGYEGRVFVTRRLSNIKGGRPAGVFLAEANIDVLKKQIQNIKLFDGAEIFLLDAQGKVLCSTEGATLSQDMANMVMQDKESSSQEAKGSLITYATSSNGWKIVSAIPIHNLTRSIDRVNVVIWVLVFISVIVAVGLGTLNSRGIIKFITQMRQSMKQAETGDLNAKVVVRSNDELSELGESFNNMLDKIKELVMETQRIIDQVLEASNSLRRNANHSIEGFNQLTLSIGNIAEGSNSQAEDTQEGASMMENLAESIKVVIAGTEEVYAKSQGTRERIEAASDSMKRLGKAMDDSAAINADIRTSIISLNDLTKTIGEVMKLLDGISEQTNLLALNASIEAARAGEVGKGFAVVANEVRNLSEQSKDSTNSVRDTLKRIEQEAAQAVELVKRGNLVFSEQEKVAEETKQSLGEMIEEMIHIDKGINQVNMRSNSMNQLKDNVGEKIESIATVTEENAAAAQELNALGEEQKAIMEQLSQVADQLNKQLEGLQTEVNQFKI